MPNGSVGSGRAAHCRPTTNGTRRMSKYVVCLGVNVMRRGLRRSGRMAHGFCAELAASYAPAEGFIAPTAASQQFLLRKMVLIQAMMMLSLLHRVSTTRRNAKSGPEKPSNIWLN